MFYTFVFIFFTSFSALFSEDITSLYYVESAEPSMHARDKEVCMQATHDKLCSLEIPLTKAAREQGLPHDPNILGAAFTVVNKNGEIRTIFLEEEKKNLFFCSNASLEMQKFDSSPSTLFSAYFKGDDVQNTLRAIANTTSENCQKLYLPGMQRILDTEKDRTQDCGHTEPKLINHLVNGVLLKSQSQQLSIIFGETKDIASIVLNLHSYLYPCSTCKDLLIHFGWYMNQILNDQNITFRISMTYRHENGSRAKPEDLPRGRLSLLPQAYPTSALDERHLQLETPEPGEGVQLGSRPRRSGTMTPSSSLGSNGSQDLTPNTLPTRKTERTVKVTDLLVRRIISKRMPILQLSAYVAKGVAPATSADTALKAYRLQLALTAQQNSTLQEISPNAQTPRPKRNLDKTIGEKSSPDEKRKAREQ